MGLAYRRYSKDYIDEEAAAAAERRGIWTRIVHAAVGVAAGALIRHPATSKNRQASKCGILCGMNACAVYILHFMTII
jgi:hypothetical protein